MRRLNGDDRVRSPLETPHLRLDDKDRTMMLELQAETEIGLPPGAPDLHLLSHLHQVVSEGIALVPVGRESSESRENPVRRMRRDNGEVLDPWPISVKLPLRVRGIDLALDRAVQAWPIPRTL